MRVPMRISVANAGGCMRKCVSRMHANSKILHAISFTHHETHAQTHTQIHLVDLHTVEALVRLLDQWTVEQGQLVLEYGLLTMLHLLTVEEARFRLYLTGVYRPFRSIILGDEGASPEAREKAVLCAWFLFEWQVEKLEILDRKVLCCPVVTAPNLRVVCVCACVCVCSCVRACVCACVCVCL